VSVIVPTYNRCAFLEGTLGSIFAQTVPVHEVVLIDDGSTDDTAAYVNDIPRSHPDWARRLRCRRQANLGKSVALNGGLALATGDWIAFNDSDDRWLPNKLELQFEALRQYREADACFTNVRFVNNPRLSKTVFEEARLHCSTTFGIVQKPYMFASDLGIYMQTVLVRTAVMRRVGEFDTGIRMSMDTDFVFRLGLVTPMCFVNLPMVEVDRTPDRQVGLMTEHPLGSVDRLQVHEYLQTKWLALVGDSDRRLRADLRNMRTRTQSELANRHLLRGEHRAARAVLYKAATQNPRCRFVAKFLWSVFAPRSLGMVIQRREERSTDGVDGRLDHG
jgi:glycosyltransferase involved in cell wall biosynthesis